MSLPFAPEYLSEVQVYFDGDFPTGPSGKKLHVGDHVKFEASFALAATEHHHTAMTAIFERWVK